MNRSILLVDDDPNILQGFRRQLRKQFDVTTAAGGKEGLEEVLQSGPFAVIVSDMQMPEMNGIQFLNTVHQLAPDSVRMMLTGNADQKTAADAVNDGRIFRFLTKPTSREELVCALESGIEQYRLVTAERELLTKTLCGSVSVLTEVLSLVNPTAFGQSPQIRRLVRELCAEVEAEKTWEIEISAMLSQVGCVTIPEESLAKLAHGVPLSQDERNRYDAHPEVGAGLIAKIPRLTGVAEIIAYQHKHYDGTGLPRDSKQGDAIPFGARVLKIAVDVVQLLSAQKSEGDVMSIIQSRDGWYDPALVEALAPVLHIDYVTKCVMIDDLAENMILDASVVSKTGQLLITAGNEVTSSLQQRLAAFATTEAGVREPLQVRCPVTRHVMDDCDTDTHHLTSFAQEIGV